MQSTADTSRHYSEDDDQSRITSSEETKDESPGLPSIPQFNPSLLTACSLLQGALIKGFEGSGWSLEFYSESTIVCYSVYGQVKLTLSLESSSKHSLTSGTVRSGRFHSSESSP